MSDAVNSDSAHGDDEDDQRVLAWATKYFDDLKAQGKCWSCGGEGYLFGPYEDHEFTRSLEDDAPEELKNRKHDCSECEGTGEWREQADA